MDLCLIGMTFDLSFVVVVLEVAIALGLVVFVHELGHFAVAKMCGVKCEKFYLGFDIGGLRLCRFRWGETEYGIGILPLGGYVKMLGQEDNPTRLKEEIERAKKQVGDSPPLPKGEGTAMNDPLPKGEGTADADVPLSPAELAAAERALYDPRSYLAKSVPQRIAIISAGVVMNVIFAFITAVAAYFIGVEKVAPVIGHVMPGEAAWKAGLQPGDEIIRIGAQPVRDFTEMRSGITFGDNLKQGLPIVVRRPGVEQPLTFNLVPDQLRLSPTIGVGNSSALTLASDPPVVLSGSSAARAEPPLEPGDRIVAVDGQPVASYAEYHALMLSRAAQPVSLTVQRKAATDNNVPATEAKESEVKLVVPPNPMRTVGMVMTMGPIVAVQVDSPAAAAGIQAGDVVVAVDGQPIDDPLRWPDELRRRAGEEISLSVQRAGAAEPVVIPVRLRPNVTDAAAATASPTVAPLLGISFEVLRKVARVEEGSPAAAAGIRPGDVIEKATILPPKEMPAADNTVADKNAAEADDAEAAPEKQPNIPFEFSDKAQVWPDVMDVLQDVRPGSRLELQLADRGKDKPIELSPQAAKDWFNPRRGFVLQPLQFIVRADGLGEALQLGAKETKDSLLMVVGVLRKLGGQVSPRALGGPIMIVQVAAHQASEGLASLLLFITVISANLAVLNILPIPLLDGGHLVFLIYEGIRGKPADERVQIGLSYLGLLLLLTLMVWVFGLDLGFIPREVMQVSAPIAA